MNETAKMMTEDEKKRAAYALNLWTVSVSRIIQYDDINVLEQEYNMIMNNLNMEKMPKDEALLDVIKEILDEITNLRMTDGDRKIVDMEYQKQVKNAIWSAVPTVGAIFATSDPVALGLTLASQVGIGYMNYRRNKAAYEVSYEKSRWQIQRNRILHLNGLQKQLFETAWRMADKYEFPDEYRLTQQQITEYNKALMETNPEKRYIDLEEMKNDFSAYPEFWYQIGSTANSIYRSKLYEKDQNMRDMYRKDAQKYFAEYDKLNQFNLLRHDMLTSAWALETIELLELNENNGLEMAQKLIKTAKDYAGNAMDIVELCAFAYLRIHDEENAIQCFHRLVNKGYNVSINLPILSGLYIKEMRSGDSEREKKAKFGYGQLSNIVEEANRKYILAIPPRNVNLSSLKFEWNKEETAEEFIERQEEQKRKEQEKAEEQRKKAFTFYQKPILLVFTSECEGETECFLALLNENREKAGKNLPPVSKCSLKEYKKKENEIEKSGDHIILIGDSPEAKKIYKKANNGRWDYCNVGIRFVTSGNKTVLLTRQLKNRQIDDFISFAKKVNEKHKVDVPEDVETVRMSFLKEMFKECLEGQVKDLASGIAAVITSVAITPLLVIGQGAENLKMGIQGIINLSKKKELDFLQYCLAFYEYLEYENALID